MGYLPNLTPTSASISAMLPAFNEAAGIEAVVRQMAAALSQHTDDFEIVVVNDGSRDATGEVLARLQLTEPELKRVATPGQSRLWRGAGKRVRRRQ